MDRQIGVHSNEEIVHVCGGKRGAELKGKTSHFTSLSEVTRVVLCNLIRGGDCRFHKKSLTKGVSLKLFWSWLCLKAGMSQKSYYLTCDYIIEVTLLRIPRQNH